jgi:hypothetical protein
VDQELFVEIAQIARCVVGDCSIVHAAIVPGSHVNAFSIGIGRRALAARGNEDVDFPLLVGIHDHGNRMALYQSEASSDEFETLFVESGNARAVSEFVREPRLNDLGVGRSDVDQVPG